MEFHLIENKDLLKEIYGSDGKSFVSTFHSIMLII